jgi:transcriptional regulator with XRE-family HTH domain
VRGPETAATTSAKGANVTHPASPQARAARVPGSPDYVNENYTLCAIEAADPAPQLRPVRWWLDRLERWQAHEPDFMTLRQVAGITRQEVAALCGIREATVRQWEAATKSPPRAIVLLLHLSGGQLGVIDPAWKDWHIRAGQLWAPHLLGRGFTPEHLKVYEPPKDGRTSFPSLATNCLRPD